jgi:hypothetical protein
LELVVQDKQAMMLLVIMVLTLYFHQIHLLVVEVVVNLVVAVVTVQQVALAVVAVLMMVLAVALAVLEHQDKVIMVALVQYLLDNHIEAVAVAVHLPLVQQATRQVMVVQELPHQ